MTQVLIDRAVLEQIVVALEQLLQDVRAVNASGSYGELLCKNITPASKALTAGRAALAGVEPVQPNETHCPHGLLIADFCKTCYTEVSDQLKDTP